MTIVTVEDARLTVQGEHRWWNLYTEIDKEDGSPPVMWTHVFPEEIFEWRIAEYNLDPNDKDTLLHMVLYEPWLDEEERDPDQSHTRARSLDRAANYHLSRIRKMGGDKPLRGRKGRSRRINPLPFPVAIESGAEDPIETLRREMVLSHSHIEAKRKVVNYHRRAVQYQMRLRKSEKDWTRPSPEDDLARLMPIRGNTKGRQ